ncbi:hypothetical protein B0H12DRAFT_1238086 [Mycena haematopus]|nr:hypothetical protein B0H12DRAFT_1245034 [Mycena haematopus]KAJ7237919.1 hypothetical protein B0H12DRAFT_1238086 [Mycena haematopus]
MAPPSLLELARRARIARQSEPATPANTDPRSSPTPSDRSQLGSDATPNPFLGGSSSSSIIPHTDRLKSFGERALKRIKLTEESQADIEERYALQFIHTLQVEDLLNKGIEEQDASWKPSKQLAKTLRDYIWTLLLLPNIRYYSGTVENAIISAARANKVKGLPLKNTNETPEVVKWLAREFSIIRSEIKSTIKSSMKAGSELENVADLASALLERTPGLNPTLGLFHRLAYIRRHLRCHKHSALEFWPKVDSGLNELHDAGPEDFLEGMKFSFEEDIEKHGDPVQSTHRPCSETFNDSCLKDLKTLSTFATQIQYIPSRKRSSKSKKRKHAEREEGDEESEEERAPQSSNGVDDSRLSGSEDRGGDPEDNPSS